MPKQSTRWKDLERAAADALGGERVVEHWTLFRERPDVIAPLPDGRRLVVDAKAYKRFSLHTLLDAVRKKYCTANDVPALVSKHAGQSGAFVTLPLADFADLLDMARATSPTTARPATEVSDIDPTGENAVQGRTGGCT